jgi:hypothetical protein
VRAEGEALIVRRVGATALILGLALAAPAAAQDPDPRLRALQALAERDAGAALEGLSALLDANPTARLRSAVERARGDALRRLGRNREAEEVWRALLARGVNVSGELLALAGARLTVTHGELVPGVAPAFRLSGERTGPVELRIYRLDSERIRTDTREGRSLFERLRAPKSGALTKIGGWTDPGFEAPGERQVSAPAPLAPGTYLLTVTAREVSIPVLLVVHGALAIVRPDRNGGVLFLAERTRGDPLGGIELKGYAADGHDERPLGKTDSAGVLRFDAGPRWVLGWRERELLLLPLPTAPVASRPLSSLVLETDLPRYRPGQTVRVRVLGPPAAVAPRQLRLVGPGGVVREERTLTPDRSGVATADLRLPVSARAGRWRIEVNESSLDLGVDRAGAETVELNLFHQNWRWVDGKPLEVDVSATLRGSKLPVGGKTVRWTLSERPSASRWPAAEASASESTLAPLPPYALRDRGGPSRKLATGTVELDPSGGAKLSIPWAGFEDARLLVLETAFEDGALFAHTSKEVIAGRSDLRLALRLSRVISAPRDVVSLLLCAADLSGRPVAGRDVLLTVRRVRPDGTREQLEERRARTDARGLVRSTLSLGLIGLIELELTSRDDVGHTVSATASLWLVTREAELFPGALEVVVDPLTGEALARFPFETGKAFAAREALGGVLSTQLLSVRRGVARWRPATPKPPGCRLVVGAIRKGKALVGEAAWVRRREGLRVMAKASAADDGQTILELGTAYADGAPRAARLDVVVYPDDTARVLDRAAAGLGAGSSAALRAAARRGLGVSLRAGSVWSNGRGVGRVRLRLPKRPGRYWARVEAVDSTGRRGATWCPVRVNESITLDVAVPATLVEGDSSEVVALVRCPPALVQPGALIRLSWRAKGLKVGAAQVDGAAVAHGGDPGSATLQFAASATRVRVVLPFSCLKAGVTALSLSAALEGDPSPPVVFERAIRALPRGLSVSRSWTGRVKAGEAAWVRLELPKAAVTEASHIEVALDPEEATAVLAGFEALGAGLRGRLQAVLTRSAVDGLLKTRTLKPQALPSVQGLVPLVHQLAAARDRQGTWGSATTSLVLALLRIRAQGGVVPQDLIAPALKALNANSNPKAWLALSLAGASPPPLRDATSDAVVFVAVARATEKGDAPTKALERAIAVASELVTVEAKAELLRLLVLADAEPELRAELTQRVLLSRNGPGWADPDDAGAALRALALVASAREEQRGSRVEAVLEGDAIVKGFSGGGLAEWTGVGRKTGVRPRSKLRIRSRAGSDVHYAVALRARVRRKLPPAEVNGLAIERHLTGAAGAVVPVGGVLAGARVQLAVSVRAVDGDHPGAASEGLWIEIPIPAGCDLLTRPAELQLVDGSLQGPLLKGSLVLDLLCRVPGEYRVLPARVRSLKSPKRSGTSVERTFRIRRSSP